MRCGSGCASWRPASKARGARSPTAHLEFLDDPDLVAAAAESIARGDSAGHAWRGAVRASIAALRDLGDTLLAERADDLLDLESQVLAALAGETGGAAIELPERAIVLADELLPSQLIALDAGRIAGIGTARGGATSHVAILAAAMDKPMLVGLGAAILGIEPGTRLWLDAERGSLQVEPPRARIAAAERELAERAAREAADRASARMPAVTADGVQIAVLANIGSAAEASEAVSRGAEGCGLLRTEFLFLDRRSAPDAATQAARVPEGRRRVRRPPRRDPHARRRRRQADRVPAAGARGQPGARRARHPRESRQPGAARDAARGGASHPAARELPRDAADGQRAWRGRAGARRS